MSNVFIVTIESDSADASYVVDCSSEDTAFDAAVEQFAHEQPSVAVNEFTVEVEAADLIDAAEREG